MRRVLLALSLLAFANPTFAQVSGKSETCREVAGKTAKDRDNAIEFCRAVVPKDLGVIGAIAMESLLWIKVPRLTADALIADRISTEQIVKSWMGRWKQLSGSKAVTLYIEWGDVEIAKGETSLFSGDKVTIKSR